MIAAQAHFQSKLLGHNGHQHVNTDGNPDLCLDCVVSCAEKMLNPQVLLDPFEEQFHLPAAFVELGNNNGILEAMAEACQTVSLACGPLDAL